MIAKYLKNKIEALFVVTIALATLGLIFSVFHVAFLLFFAPMLILAGWVVFGWVTKDYREFKKREGEQK